MIGELILLGIISSVSSQMLHHMMTPEELNNIFSVKNSAEVPTYDVVPVSITKPRNRRYNDLYLTTTRFGENLKLWLTPLDGILVGENVPILSLYHNPAYSWEPKMINHTGDVKLFLPLMYENTLHATTVAVNNHPNGRHTLTGYIGNSYIQPVPPRLMEHARRRRSLNNTLEHEFDNQIYHIIRKIPETDVKFQSQAIEIPAMRNTTSRSKRLFPQIVYPEVLVIVDFNYSAFIGNHSIDKLIYLMAFWNGVDMRFRSLENPRVRLNIAGFIFAEDTKVLPYMQIKNGLLTNSGHQLRYKGNWWYGLQGYFPINYDLAVTMTPFRLCDGFPRKCNILGQAYVQGACLVDHNKRTIDKVAFVRDRGAYDGIQTAAHELGHLFGMKHDGQENKNCPDENGYIMTTYDKFTPQAFDWSNCSLIDMHNYLRSERGWCLYNYPKQGEPVRRYLPGRRMNADEQCKMLVNGTATVIDDHICAQLKCSESDGWALPEAAEGTPCGSGKLCLHGKCVLETKIV
ncbi:A disintegrin and metalloproteinase with thrombospondin motifs like [Microplitis mediator]|uniref:A disintegrin and metalloproteinase with thrombospondin motifs like n=1 Tax=Microplitis mediator TaxID=375433 RepID=UPI0025547E6B|nr:A disintegrin and metalloproteinase with thrombospondin motifs like [Microplitis mediator]